MEILDLYDNEGNSLNETIVRGDKNILPGKNIMLSIAYILDNDGRYLIQKTSKEKGNNYSSTGGHVIHNENGLQAIIRELKEELNVKKCEEKIKHITTFKFSDKPLIINVYMLKLSEEEKNSIIIQKSEVEEIQWLNKNEILELIEKEVFTKTHSYIFYKYIINEK